MENLVELVPDITLNYSPQYFRLNQFDELITQFSEQETLRQALDLDVDIEHIRQRYEGEQGFFTKLAEQYVSLQWWLKLLLGLVAIGIGCVLNISIWVSIICYIGISLLFFEHTQKNNVYQTRVFADIRQLKLDLTNTIQHTDTIKDHIIEIKQNIDNLNIELAQTYQIHQTQIQELNSQIESSQAIIGDLTQKTQTLTVNLSSHKEELEKACQLVRQHEQALAEQSQKLQDINASFGMQIDAIQVHNKELREKRTELSEILAAFSSGNQQEDDLVFLRAQAVLASSDQIIASTHHLISSTTVNSSIATNNNL